MIDYPGDPRTGRGMNLQAITELVPSIYDFFPHGPSRRWRLNAFAPATQGYWYKRRTPRNVPEPEESTPGEEGEIGRMGPNTNCEDRGSSHAGMISVDSGPDGKRTRSPFVTPRPRERRGVAIDSRSFPNQAPCGRGRRSTPATLPKSKAPGSRAIPPGGRQGSSSNTWLVGIGLFLLG
jgi:hypothetical protein